MAQFKSIFLIASLLIIFKLSGISCGPLWPYGQQKVRGVNLGSWLVLEKWITPNVFAGLPDDVGDEFTLCQRLGKVEAKKRLQAHWDSWIKESDIIALKNAGVNHIRIPVGYWALDIRDGEPWVSGSWDYVVKAAGWAKKQGIQVMVDLHAVPGSQNGNDHSGKSGPILFFDNDDNLNRATNVLGKIAQWANADEWRNTVTIIQLVNEPILWQNYNFRLGKLKQFYRQGYDEIRKFNKDVVVAVHDAFIDLTNWYYLRDDTHYYSVMLDTHLYQVFGDGWKDKSCEQHAAYPCQTYPERLTNANQKLWTVVGEFSLATPHSCQNQAEFAKQQIGVYEKGSGWFFWSAKHQQGWNEWSFLDSVRLGWINLHNTNQPSC